MTIATNPRDDSLASDICTSVDYNPRCVASDSSIGYPFSDPEIMLLSGKCTPRIYSRVRQSHGFMGSNNGVHINQRSTSKLSVVRMKLAHAQLMNIAKKGLLAIEVDFLARALECTLATT